MHELAICQSLLSEVGRVAELHGAREVNGGRRRCRSFVRRRAASCWSGRSSVARAGTVADHAALEIEMAPVVVWCKSLRDRDARRRQRVAVWRMRNVAGAS